MRESYNAGMVGGTYIYQERRERERGRGRNKQRGASSRTATLQQPIKELAPRRSRRRVTFLFCRVHLV